MGFNDYIEDYEARKTVETKEEKGKTEKRKRKINWPNVIDDISDWILKLAIVGVCIKFIFKR